MLSVVATKHLPGFRLNARFESDGHVTALFGRSGAGKTTLLNIIAGLVRPDAGRICLGDTVLVDTGRGIFLAPRRRRIGYVFQETRLFPHLSVKANLVYGRRAAPRSERWAALDDIIDLLGIGHLLSRPPATLSGGEKQRVAIGRALLASPRLLLMDEPLAAIDPARRAEILPYLDRLRTDLRVPLVYVSHAVEEVARIADTLVVLDGGDTVAAGPAPDLLARLDLPAIADGVPSAVITGRIAALDADAGHAVVTHAAGPLIVPGLARPVGSRVRIVVRARDVALAVGEPGRLSIRNRLPATVTAIVSSRPPSVDVRLDLAGEPLLARITADAVADLGLSVGSPVTALIKAVAIEGTA